jgi:hypothetical protein
VAKKANLTKDKGQEDGIAELKPEIVYNQEIGNADYQQAHCEKDLVRIISGLFIQQLPLCYQLFQRRVLIDRWVRD